MRATKEMLENMRLRLISVVGFDDDGDGEEGSGSENDDETDEDDDEGHEESDDDKPDADKLKKALKDERRQRRKFERDFKRLKKQQDDASDEGKSEAENARREAEEHKQRSAKLADRLLKSSVDNTITKLAQKMKFRDIDDALKLVDRDSIEVDQDEDEPQDVEIDETSVNDALKKLAKDKPHLLIAAGDETPSGGNLGSKGKGKDELDDEKLKELYPALRR